jgi:hypothetical protein
MRIDRYDHQLDDMRSTQKARHFLRETFEEKRATQ